MKFPPCVWAHSDESIVRRAFAVARAAAEEEERKQTELDETRKRYSSGRIDFSEPHEDDQTACEEANHGELALGNEREADQSEEQGPSCYVADAPSPTTVRTAEPPAKKEPATPNGPQ